MRKSLFSSIVLASLSALLLSCGGGASAGADASYPVRAVCLSSTAIETSYPASIKGDQDVEIRPKIQGFITDIKVKPGQMVRRGQLLFVLDNETYQAAVTQAHAAIASAEAQLRTAQLTYDNSQQLYDKNVIGAYELSSAQNSYEVAQAALAQAQANYAEAKQNLDFCFVTSPANGIVGDMPYKVGALVSASMSTPFTTVSDISTVQVYFSMPESEILSLTREYGGLDATVEAFPALRLLLADGSLYESEGRVVAISGVIDASTGSLLLRADFPNAAGLLRSGGAGAILVPHTNAAAIVVPQEAVQQVQDKYFVYLVAEDNTVKYSEVKVDPIDDGINYTITGGLAVGDRYVVKGVSSLVDGMAITPLSEEEYAAALAAAQAMGGDQGSLTKLKEDLAK